MELFLEILFAIIFLFIFYLISAKIVETGNKIFDILLTEVSKMPLPNLIISVFGMIIGFIVAYFLSNIVKEIPYVGIPLAFLLYILFAYIGFSIGTIKNEDFTQFLKIIGSKDKSPETTQFSKKNNTFTTAKILDTSAIIDGRVLDVINSGFIEGKIVVADFVLEELRHIADSADDLKRIKGRRGLDILNEIRTNKNILVENTDVDFDDIHEVDAKLLKLAQKLNASIITNDYNLNKVAKFQNVKVLNINELANAIKTKLAVGEELSVYIVKEGKEHSQGIGYLDDGTMIVVEDGKNLIGSTVNTTVTSVIQTNAGRMIFVRVNN